MQLLKLQRPREFKIETRFYKPEAEQESTRQIHFRRIRHVKRTDKTSPIRLLIFIVILAFAIFYLQKKSDVMRSSPTAEPFQVEEIIVVD